MIVRLEISPQDTLPQTLSVSLFVVNIIELLMELTLYGAFLQVLCVLRTFLQSFDEMTMPEIERESIKRSRRIFIVVSSNTVVLMFTNSMFSLLSPLLWISDVFFSNPTLSICFIVAVQLFYLTNTIFSLLMLYALHHFARYDTEDGPAEVLTGSSAKVDQSMRTDSAMDDAFKMQFRKRGSDDVKAPASPTEYTGLMTEPDMLPSDPSLRGHHYLEIASKGHIQNFQ